MWSERLVFKHNFLDYYYLQVFKPLFPFQILFIKCWNVYIKSYFVCFGSSSTLFSLSHIKHYTIKVDLLKFIFHFCIILFSVKNHIFKFSDHSCFWVFFVHIIRELLTELSSAWSDTIITSCMSCLTTGDPTETNQETREGPKKSEESASP